MRLRGDNLYYINLKLFTDMTRVIFTVLLLLNGVFLFGNTKPILMKKNMACFHIPCKVNGQTLDFTLDIVPDEFTISLSEAIYLIKNNSITQDELLGVTTNQILLGELPVSCAVMLREVEIDAVKINNVKATIARETSAPLILNQNALPKLGSIIIDPMKGTFTILQPNNGSYKIQPWDESNCRGIVNETKGNFAEF